MDMFTSALFEGKVHEATNRGFRKATGRGNTLGYQLYEQTKRGVNSDYDKRHVMKNKVNTYPRSWDEQNWGMRGEKTRQFFW